ncbi:CWF19-like protein 1 homolog isoform X2 [Anoplophora glabripennis]|uniref:CWF19-like protein 1 homolog isoform X2 n=1 Tax=Anoplophora glabripennis TaxID=217634 RepID=UPI000874FCC4|nr:CWF19-like protein 1 homolog isoform X2 [Anoplophora glabripennis]
MSDKQKILLCGDVEGKFDTLFKRVESINKKSGPFDILLCVGNFFGVNNKEFTPYKIGDKKVPVPTYILGPNKEDHVPFYPSDDSEFELCDNVYYLGKRGVYTDSKGVKIAYLSGIFETNIETPWTYNAKDVSGLCDACVRGNPSFRGVDILLTSQWPAGIISGNSNVSLSTNAVSDLPSYLCMKLKPRYLVSGLEGIYYERPPFRCPNLGDHDTTLESVTRFIGLARVGNPNKDKWIYALSITPLDKMKMSDLFQKTTDETPCPFNFNELESKIFKIKRKISGVNQYFYDMNATDEGEEKNKKRNKKPRIEMDQSKCWFCLASPSVEKHLIIAVGNAAYLALAKGGIVEEHLLICPIEHYQSSLGQPPDVLEEINQFKEALKKFYLRNNRIPVFFERNYKTSHMQLQAIPIPKNADRELKDIFVDESEAQGFKLDVLESHGRLDQVIPLKVPYFTVELPDGTVLYTKIQGSVHFPLNFPREVLSSGPVLDMPNRVEWKDCILPKEEEEELVQRLRTDFEPFDFTM